VLSIKDTKASLKDHVDFTAAVPTLYRIPNCKKVELQGEFLPVKGLKV
jgi:hypothetical protein